MVQLVAPGLEVFLRLQRRLTLGNWKCSRKIFKETEHFPNVQEQIQGERDVSPHVDFMDKLIGNFKSRFDSFSLGQKLLLLIQNPFLITDVRGFSKECLRLFSLV
ncbi:unnamed protein product [Boreogadus saida]